MSNATLVRSLHHAKVCFIPHPDNNHHPLVLRHKPLTAISALLIVAKIVAISIIGLTPSEATLSTITTNRIVQLTNDERVKAGLSPLTINNQLTHAAQLKANDMFKNQYFAHISPTGVTPWYWMQQSGYSYQIAGENLAIDFTQAEDVVAAWMASPKHKENILRPEYTQTGVAVMSGQFKGSTSIIVVHMFGDPMPASIPSTSPTPPPSVLLSAKALPPKLSPKPSPSPEISPTPVPTPETLPTPGIATLVLSPSFDQEEFAIPSLNTNYSWQLFSTHSAIAFTSDVISAVPLFTIHSVNQSSTTFFTTISRISREFSGSIAVAVFALLTIAIFVRIRIQRPLMIAHASIVILLAFALFLA